MGKKLINDFVVDMNRNCFLCLEESLQEHSQPSSSIHSLHHLSRYLKMNFSNIFDGKGAIPSRFLATMERSRLKVTLCEGCASLTEKFSELCQQLEKTEMEVNSCLGTIQDKLLGADKIGRIRQYMTGSNDKNDLIGNLEIVEGLRKEAKQKCSIKLRNATPRVAIQDFLKSSPKAARSNPNAVNQKATKEKSNCNFFTQAVLEAYQDKAEVAEEASQIISDQNADICGVENERIGKAAVVEGNFEIYNYALDAGPMIELNPAKDTSCGVLIYDQNDYEYDYQEPEEGAMENPENYPLIYGGSPTVPTATEDYWQPKSIFDPRTRKHKCGLCFREYKHERSFQDHYRGDHLQQKFKCKVCDCGKEFTFRQNYHKHLRTAHHNDGSETRKEGKSDNVKTQHVRGSKKLYAQQRTPPKSNDTADEEDFSTKTDYSFEVINSYKRGIRGGTKPYTLDSETGQVKCNECSWTTKQMSSFHRHYNGVHLKVRYRCKLCMREFIRRDTYFTHHEGVHMGLRHKCSKCSKYFKLKSELTQHERKKTCRSGVRQPPLQRRKLLMSLHKHKKASTKNRKYRCHICGLQFVFRKVLKEHLLAVHPQEMEIKCDPCGKKFSRRHHLTRHLLGVHHKANMGV